MLVKLSDICDIIPGYAFKGCDFSNDGANVVKITDITPPNVDTVNCSKVNLSNYNLNKLKKFKIKSGDYIIAMTGATIGKLGKVSSGEAYLNQRVAKFCPTGINKQYLYYVLSTNRFNSFIMNNIDSSSAQPNISSSSIGRYTFDCHDEDSQLHIVNILGSIDDKIENNEKKCIDLEHLMLKNFSVFYTKLSKYTKTTISEYFDISIGRTQARKEFQWFEENINKNNMKWISISDMGNINTFIFNTAENLTLEAINKFNIPIIPENTVILSFKLTVGRVAITTEKMLSNEAIAHFKTDNKIIVPYLYAYLKNYNFNKLGNTSSIATATNSTAIKNMIFNVLSDQELIDFYKRNQPILDNILSIQKQNIKLNKLKQLYLKKFFG